MLVVLYLARNAEELPYHYVVFYNFTGDGKSGFGQIEMNISTKMDTFEAVESVRKHIQENNKLEKVVIMGFVRVKN